jgi:hypothetical protein
MLAPEKDARTSAFGGGMRRIGLIATLIALAFSMAGCAETPAALRQPVAAKAHSPAVGEEMVLADIPPYSFVRDTPAALASLMHPLAPAPGRNDLVAACRAMVEKSAEAHGAERVEAVSAGPQRRVRDGTVAPVRFRIFYPGILRSQVRQAKLLCKADRAGNVVDARP